MSHSSAADARKVIREVAVDITDATNAVVWELASDGSLASVTSAGADLSDLIQPGAQAPQSIELSWDSSEPILISDARTDPRCDHRMVAALGVESVLFQPIRTESRVHGVLAVHWSERRDEVSRECEALLAVLADEAAVAIDRADLMRQLEELAHTDELTGLPNRRAWEERCRRELRRAAPRGRRCRGDARPRPLQALQRRARPPGGRPAAQGRRRRVAGGAAAGRPARALGRRGVRGSAPGLRRRGRPSAGRSPARRDAGRPDLLHRRGGLGRAGDRRSWSPAPTRRSTGQGTAVATASTRARPRWLIPRPRVVGGATDQADQGRRVEGLLVASRDPRTPSSADMARHPARCGRGSARAGCA